MRSYVGIPKSLWGRVTVTGGPALGEDASGAVQLTSAPSSQSPRALSFSFI